jgi:hypothetical protein
VSILSGDWNVPGARGPVLPGNSGLPLGLTCDRC